MIRSMTGYGAAEARHEDVLVTVELRSVNHRHLDSQIRITRDHAGLEGRIREKLGLRLVRGRVSAVVDVQSESTGGSLVLDEKLAADYRDVFRRLEESFGLAAPSDAGQFAMLPDVVRRQSQPLDPAAVEAALDRAIDAALDQLVEMREREGKALGDDLAGRVRRIEELLTGVESQSEGAVQRTRSRLEERIAQIVPEGTRPDEERLATEIALMAEKADITEEVVRFRAHDEAFLGFLEKGEPVGKRLDFLLQEMNREANTIGSKSASAPVAHLVVELKEEIERLREQVQNIE